MNLEDFIIAPREFRTEDWHLGNQIQNKIIENGIVLLFVSDYRGARGSAEMQDFDLVRKHLYRLSTLDFETPLCDLGDLISGKTIQDTHYILQEILSLCHYKNAIPVIIGGSVDLSYALFSALNFHYKNIDYTHISNVVSLINDDEVISEKNFLSKVFSTKNFSIKDFHLLGYQKHLNELDSVKLIQEVDFDVIRLAEMMGSTEAIEPYFRRSNLITLNCDAVESFNEPFSVHPQVNGLNRREICAYLKEAGLSENLQSVGIFNYNIESGNELNNQLLAQMIWYLIEGINIQKSHPREKSIETFVVLVNDSQYVFKRDTFTNLWYFGDHENLKDCIPCSRLDYDSAKRGIINQRFL